MVDIMGLNKAIEKAFQFHPFGFEKPQMYNDWVMGPTFIVKVPMTEEEMVFNFMANVYNQDPDWQIKFTKLLGEAKNASVSITLDKDKHLSKPACTYRMYNDEPNAIYKLELAYPLVMLAKKVGIVGWKTTPGANNVMVFGYNSNGDLTGVFAGRRVTTDHVQEA